MVLSISDTVLCRGIGGSVLDPALGRVDGASVGVKSEKDTTCGVLGPTGFPCRALGGGGAFVFFVSSLPEARLLNSSSSDLGTSYEVRGESTLFSALVSFNDCRDIEDVYVLLLPPIEITLGVAVTDEGTAEGGAAFPVINMRVNELTSMTCRVGWASMAFAVAFDVGASLGTESTCR